MNYEGRIIKKHADKLKNRPIPVIQLEKKSIDQQPSVDPAPVIDLERRPDDELSPAAEEDSPTISPCKYFISPSPVRLRL
jgi:hypothetical protein